MPLGFDLDHHARQIKEIRFNDSQFITSNVFLDENGFEGRLVGILAQFDLYLVWIKADQRLQAPQKLFLILDLFGDDVEIIGGPVIHQQFTTSVENHSPKRGDILELNPVILGLNPELGPFEYLKRPEPQHQNGKEG